MDHAAFYGMLEGTRLDAYDRVFEAAVARYTGDACVVADVRRWRDNTEARMWIVGWLLYMYGDDEGMWACVMRRQGDATASPMDSDATAPPGGVVAAVDYYLDHILETMQDAVWTRCDVWERMHRLRDLMQTMSS